ncbi:MAG: MazG nucleotide pyrophosphohydrolase domain-containing protein [Candidatus Hinthialibacter antarcticus]|nr:MazG nucleotide pyrophosphohydrolase domain-containing protein [Candidatus Hinthialibacter antarcticus]
MANIDTKCFPKSYDGICRIQNEFQVYQNTMFPSRDEKFFILELNGEAGELANIEKKDWKGIKIDPARFEDEAADVLIALLNYCNARGIDLASAVEAKMKKIHTKRTQEIQEENNQ